MLILRYLTLTILCLSVPLTAIAQPSKEGEISVYPLPPIEEITEPILEPVLKPELPYSILSNCWAYVKYIYPDTPSTATIRASLGASGEIGVLYYASSGLWHYVVVESVDGDQVTFSETNFNGHTKSTRTLPSAAFAGFYDLP